MKQIFILLVSFLTISFFSGCTKEELARIPDILTTPVTDIKVASMTSGGNITSDGGATVTSRGVCWGVRLNPTSSDSTTIDGDGTGQFISSIARLSGNTIYHVRAYATNSVGTAYGADILFSTNFTFPTITTSPIYAITSSTATSGGNISSDCGAPVTARGVIWSTNPDQTIDNNITSDGAGTGSFTSNISGLNEGTTYFVRAYAINNAGTGYGLTISLTTLGQIPTCSTQSATNVQMTSATLNAAVNANYLSTMVSFEYGTTTGYGHKIISSESPISGNLLTSVSANVSGLSEYTTYHYRVIAVNSLGTVFGEDLIFSKGGKVSDYEGNEYPTVVIGNQEWMSENLRATNYNDGTDIPLVNDNIKWSKLTTPGYCWYNEDEASYKATYGAIYNNYAAYSDNLCPTGWHIPNLKEWKILIDYLGGSDLAGGRLKESGIIHWRSPNTGATNASAFLGLPGGILGNWDGTWPFRGINTEGNWWTSTKPTDIYNSYNWIHLQNDKIESYIFGGSNAENTGMSVRCLRD
jgi:uncharacterized protein (TIGR02145 family)